MSAMPPLSYQLLDVALDGKLDAYLDERRAKDDSYDAIAYDLSVQTGVRLSGENIRRWHAQSLAERAEATS